MKALFHKDLRENLKLSLIGLAIFALLLTLLSGSEAMRYTQPLLSSQFLQEANLFCAIFGTALGWLQTRNEAHRDLWAFLIHRPATRTDIFLGKSAAGLCLYALGAGLPLLGFTLYLSRPGHAAAPFEWEMALPGVAIFLTGAAYYFAGMLTALRQARWYGSRAFGLGLAVFASLGTLGLPEFWSAAGLTLLVTAILAMSAWGAYQSGGFYQGQPEPGKAALAFTLAGGSFVAVGFLAALLGTLLPNRPAHPWQSFRMTRDDGKIWVMTAHEGEWTVADLEGKPPLDPVTGKPMDMQQFNRRAAPSATMFASFGEERGWRNRYNDAARFFTLWKTLDKIQWYVDRHGQLLAFSTVTARPVAGLFPNAAAAGQPFIRPGYHYAALPPNLLATRTGVFLANPGDHLLAPLFTTTAADPVIGFAEIFWRSTNVAVMTRTSIHILDARGGSQAVLPYQPGFESYPQVEVLALESEGQFAVWFHPNSMLNEKNGGKLPEHVAWLAGGDKAVKTAEFPALNPTDFESPQDKAFLVLLAPTIRLAFVGGREPSWILWLGVLSCAGGALVCGVYLRRYKFSPGAAAGWLVFVLGFGIPALLAFFCAQEWPKSEPCPQCGKSRPVDGEHCAHCAAAFAPPERIGIEIFEPLG